jgi:CO/xanthine dehydrogenase Mo-binding subunit
VHVTRHRLLDMPIRTSSLRSLGAHLNVFAIESFMDELAAAAGEFRQLADDISPWDGEIYARVAADPPDYSTWIPGLVAAVTVPGLRSRHRWRCAAMRHRRTALRCGRDGRRTRRRGPPRRGGSVSHKPPR